MTSADHAPAIYYASQFFATFEFHSCQPDTCVCRIGIDSLARWRSPNFVLINCTLYWTNAFQRMERPSCDDWLAVAVRRNARVTEDRGYVGYANDTYSFSRKWKRWLCYWTPMFVFVVYAWNDNDFGYQNKQTEFETYVSQHWCGHLGTSELHNVKINTAHNHLHYVHLCDKPSSVFDNSCRK